MNKENSNFSIENQNADRDIFNVAGDYNGQKSIEIELIQKRLQLFYLPLQNVISSVLPDEDYHEQTYTINKAYALNDVLKEVKNFNYLATPKLRQLIIRFPYLLQCFNNPSLVTMHSGDAYGEISTSLPIIESLINNDIKKYYKKLDEITQ